MKILSLSTFNQEVCLFSLHPPYQRLENYVCLREKDTHTQRESVSEIMTVGLLHCGEACTERQTTVSARLAGNNGSFCS